MVVMVRAFFPVLGGPGNTIDPENPETYVTHPLTGEIDGPSISPVSGW